MKKTGLIILVVVILCMAVFTGCANNDATVQKETPVPTDSATPTVSTVEEATPTPTSAPVVYKDGVYEGKSPLTSEAYYGKVSIAVKDGAITEVDFNIYDTRYFKDVLPESETKDMTEKLMDKEYGETVFASTPHYVEQTYNELIGMSQYEQVLIDTQDLGDVDVMSKATWSYYIYQDAVRDALKKAANN